MTEFWLRTIEDCSEAEVIESASVIHTRGCSIYVLERQYLVELQLLTHLLIYLPSADSRLVNHVNVATAILLSPNSNPTI